MRRPPIRLRLALAFAGVMAVVLAATGLFLYLHLRSDLDRTINRGLRSRAADVTALVQQADTGLRDAGATRARGAVDVAQILRSDGRIFDASPGLGRTPAPHGVAARRRAAGRRLGRPGRGARRDDAAAGRADPRPGARSRRRRGRLAGRSRPGAGQPGRAPARRRCRRAAAGVAGRLRPGLGRAAPGGVHAPPGRLDLVGAPARAPAARPHPRRAASPRADPQRHAGPPRGGHGAPARVHRRG